MHKAGLRWYGVRVAEPHHDGTVHWHLLCFMRKKDRRTLTALLRKFAIREDRTELGNNTYGDHGIRIYGNACSSTLVKLLNQKRWADACRQLPRWVYVKGVFNQGLDNRRTREMAWCMKGAGV
ncbi:Bacteriophage replication protein GPA [compost metagenome]